MNNEQLLKYAPIAIVVIALIIQWKMFVTPAEVETKHRLIMAEVAEKYVTKEENQSTKEELKEIKVKVDKIYDILINQKR